MIHARRLAVFLVGLLCTVPVTFGETVAISSSQDTTLYENAFGLLGNGSGSHLFAGRSLQAANSVRRTLIAFDVAANVPLGSRIDSVVLVMFMSRTRTGTTQSIELHRVLADWGEGASNAPAQEGNGAPSEPGDATWVHTFYDTGFWSAPGGDVATTPSAAIPVATIGQYSWGPTPEMANDVQAWLDAPATNHGWMLTGNESTFATIKRFDSRENAVVAQQPVLTVTFTRPTPGACCDGTIGSCADGVLAIDCMCDQCVWTSGAACTDIAPCVATIGACCDPLGSLGGGAGSCVPNLSEADCLVCADRGCVWFAGESCVDVNQRGDCSAAVPATSTWHLIFAALAVLVVAKIRGVNSNLGDEPSNTTAL